MALVNWERGVVDCNPAFHELFGNGDDVEELLAREVATITETMAEEDAVVFIEGVRLSVQRTLVGCIITPSTAR